MFALSWGHTLFEGEPTVPESSRCSARRGISRTAAESVHREPTAAERMEHAIAALFLTLSDPEARRASMAPMLCSNLNCEGLQGRGKVAIRSWLKMVSQRASIIHYKAPTHRHSARIFPQKNPTSSVAQNALLLRSWESYIKHKSIFYTKVEPRTTARFKAIRITANFFRQPWSLPTAGKKIATASAKLCSAFPAWICNDRSAQLHLESLHQIAEAATEICIVC